MKTGTHTQVPAPMTTGLESAEQKKLRTQEWHYCDTLHEDINTFWARNDCEPKMRLSTLTAGSVDYTVLPSP